MQPPSKFRGGRHTTPHFVVLPLACQRNLAPKRKLETDFARKPTPTVHLSPWSAAGGVRAVGEQAERCCRSQILHSALLSQHVSTTAAGPNQTACKTPEHQLKNVLGRLLPALTTCATISAPYPFECCVEATSHATQPKLQYESCGNRYGCQLGVSFTSVVSV